jgi:molecular chaperone GrpE
MTTQDDTQIPEDSELEALKAELETMTATAQRALADLQNFKRHAETQRAELGIYANIQLLNALFPVIDNFGRAFEHVPEELAEHEFVKGIQGVQSSLMNTLKNLGLEPIDQIGVPMDPNLHEVLMEADGPKNEVMQIFETGYTFKGQTLKPAKVQVGKGNEA